MREQREHQSFHIGLKAFITDGDKLLILQDEDGLWELPGGRVEKGEIFEGLAENSSHLARGAQLRLAGVLEKSLRREVAEELGSDFQYEVGRVFHAWIRKPEFAASSPYVSEYRDKDLCLFLVGITCEYKSGEPELSLEHQKFRWITREEVDNLDFENTYKDAIKKYFQHVGKNKPG